MKQRLNKLNRADVTIGVLTGVMVGFVASLVFGPLGGFLGGAFAAYTAAAGIQRQRAALQLRIDNPTAINWDVAVNKVHVGTISDAEYAGLEMSVLADWRVHCAQGRNLATVGMRIINMLIFAVPIALFWLALGLVLVDPEAAANVAEALRAAPGSEIVAAVDRYARIAMLAFALGVLMLAFVASPRLGYRNVFRDELGEAVRRRVRAAAVGRLVLTPCQLPARAPAV